VEVGHNVALFVPDEPRAGALRDTSEQHHRPLRDAVRTSAQRAPIQGGRGTSSTNRRAVQHDGALSPSYISRTLARECLAERWAQVDVS
jgi:hypothetical protein